MTKTEVEVAQIARRALRDKRSKEQVEISLFAPTQRANEDVDADAWECRVELRRNSNQIGTRVGHGRDSLQALIHALTELHLVLKRDMENYLWGDDPAGCVGIPLIVSDDDPDFLALIEHLASAERFRREVLRRRIDQIVRGKPASPPSDADME